MLPTIGGLPDDAYLGIVDCAEGHGAIPAHLLAKLVEILTQ